MPASVLVVGYPGMEPTLVDQFMADGTMPTFAELASRGRRHDLGNRLDHLPDVVWPEIFTGRNGAELGWYRLPAQLFAGETTPRPVRLDDFDLTAFWDYASRAGRTVAVLDIPYSGSSPDLNGLLLRGWGTHDKPFGTATEPDPRVLDDLLSRYGPYPVGHSHSEHTRCDDHDDTTASYRELRDNLLNGFAAKTRLFAGVLDGRDWDLFACAYEEAHCAGHQLWHHHDPDSPWHDPAVPDDVKDSLRDVHARADDDLAHLLERAGDGATVFLVLSHGMQTAGGGWQLLAEVLVRLGYGSGATAASRLRGRLPEPVKSVLRTALRGRARSSLQRVGGSLPEPLASPATRAAALMNSPCGAIRLNVKGRDPFGALDPGAEYEAACEEIQHELYELVDARTGRPAVRQVTLARALYGERLHANIPDILVDFEPELAPIESVRSPRVGTVSRPVRTPALPRSGDHTLRSALIVAGPDVEPTSLPQAGNVVDIAPTVLGLLDVDVPETFDGVELRLASRPTALGEPAA